MFGPIPFETLPGWELAPNPSAIEVITLLLGVPGAIFVVILLLTMTPSWFGKGGSEAAIRSEN